MGRRLFQAARKTAGSWRGKLFLFFVQFSSNFSTIKHREKKILSVDENEDKRRKNKTKQVMQKNRLSFPFFLLTEKQRRQG